MSCKLSVELESQFQPDHNSNHFLWFWGSPAVGTAYFKTEAVHIITQIQYLYDIKDNDNPINGLEMQGSKIF